MSYQGLDVDFAVSRDVFQSTGIFILGRIFSKMVLSGFTGFSIEVKEFTKNEKKKKEISKE